MKKILFLVFAAASISSALFAQPRTEKEPPEHRAGQERPQRRPDTPKKGERERERNFPQSGQQEQESGEFLVVYVQANDESVKILFNKKISPKSVRADEITVNGHPLQNAALIKFSRTGKIIECKVALPKGIDSTLSLSSVESISGTKIANPVIKGIKPGYKIEFDEKGTGNTK